MATSLRMATSLSPEEQKIWDTLVKTSSRRLIDSAKKSGIDVQKFEDEFKDEKLTHDTRELLIKTLFQKRTEVLLKQLDPVGVIEPPMSEMMKFMQEMAKIQLDAQLKMQTDLNEAKIAREKFETESKLALEKEKIARKEAANLAKIALENEKNCSRRGSKPSKNCTRK